MRSALDFDRAYLAVHVPKEELFWTTYMGLEKDSAKLTAAEQTYKTYVGDPKNLADVRAALAALPDGSEHGPERGVLQGWQRFFAANCVEDPAAQRLAREVLEAEAVIFEKRAGLRLSFKTSGGDETPGSVNVMASNIAASPDVTVRQTSHAALLAVERWVLDNGFLELVRRRNAFARALGAPNYFAYSVMKKESLTETALRSILDEFESLTREACFSHLERLARAKGADVLQPHNLRFAVAGDAERKLDPYLPFSQSLERWAWSFARLGVRYRDAALTLDLCDRVGKYDNGFMHGPGPAFYDRGTWVPARINFTSNATPNQVGSGRRGLVTLFHEGGHAAHFANISQASPCFSQEYPPTSMAYAETQSMFMDSLLGDGDWLALYARDARGHAIPDELIELFVTSDQPFRAFQERSILVVPTFESRLYALADDELDAETVLALARRTEKEILGVECSPRPLLAIPHLIGGESACSYQGYLLAHMAVYQTRAHFESRYGQLVDHPEIGPDLVRDYWSPGNSLTHDETVRRLTGRGLTGLSLADRCNLDSAALWAKTKREIAAARARPRPNTGAPQLDARIRVVHGAETVATNERSMTDLFADFARWTTTRYPAAGSAS